MSANDPSSRATRFKVCQREHTRCANTQVYKWTIWIIRYRSLVGNMIKFKIWQTSIDISAQDHFTYYILIWSRWWLLHISLYAFNSVIFTSIPLKFVKILTFKYMKIWCYMYRALPFNHMPTTKWAERVAKGNVPKPTKWFPKVSLNLRSWRKMDGWFNVIHKTICSINERPCTMWPCLRLKITPL